MNFFKVISKYRNLPEILVVWAIEPKNNFLKVISKYRHFPRNIKLSIGDRGKNNFFKVVSKYRNFPRNIDGLGDRAKKQFFRQKSIFSRWSQNIAISPEILVVWEIEPKNHFLAKNQFLQSDFKISPFSPKYW